MNSDFKDLLLLFNDKKVKYLVVGGYAVILYTQPRYTGDIDIWIEASTANSLLVFDALKEFGAPVSTLAAKDFALPGFFFQMGIPPNRIDILMSISGVEFDDAWKNKEDVDIDGQIFSFICRDDLEKSKMAAGRPKDIADLEALRQAKN